MMSGELIGGAVPRVPAPFARLGGLLPTAAHSAVLAAALNRVFAAQLRDGELDFLDGRVMEVTVRDAGLRYRLSLEGGRLVAARAGREPELTIDGRLYDFLLLATRREDADTLFFSRRLRLGGDTDLGLNVKNFLDAVEPEAHMMPLISLAGGAASAMERFAPRS